MKFSRYITYFIMLAIFLLTLSLGNVENHLSLIEGAEAAGSSEQEQINNTEEQFAVAVLPFYITDNSGKKEADSKFTKAVEIAIKEKFPDLSLISLGNCTGYDEEKIARSQGREAGANLIIYGEIENDNGHPEEVTYHIIPLSGFEIDSFSLKNPEALAYLSARASCSTIESKPLILPEVDEKNYSSLLNAVNSFKKYKGLDFESALSSFQSIKGYESNYQLLFYIANCHYFENELNDSRYFYEKVLELEPQTTEAMLNKANALAFLGSPKTVYQGQEEFDRNFEFSWQAIDLYDRIIEIDPNSAVAWNNKGCFLNEMGKPEEALEACEKALEIDPNLELAWRNKGDCLAALGRYDEATGAYDEALKIDPKNPGDWCGRASALLVMGKSEESLEACEKGLEMNPENWVLWQNKGNALSFLSRQEKAQEAYNRALELNPQLAIAWMNKGNIYQETGEMDKALEAYDKALLIDPHYSLVWFNKGNTYYELGEMDKALEAYDKALSIDPDCPAVWFNKGNVYYDSEKYEEAIYAYDKCLKTDPGSGYAWLNKAYAFYYLGRYEDSLEATDKVIEINPQSSSAWFNKADILSEMNREEESNKAYWKALKCLSKEWIGI